MSRMHLKEPLRKTYFLYDFRVRNPRKSPLGIIAFSADNPTDRSVTSLRVFMLYRDIFSNRVVKNKEQYGKMAKQKDIDVNKIVGHRGNTNVHDGLQRLFKLFPIHEFYALV